MLAGGGLGGGDLVLDEWFEEQTRKRNEAEEHLTEQARQLRKQVQRTSVQISIGTIDLRTSQKYGEWLPEGVYDQITTIFGRDLNQHAMKRVAAVSHLLFDTTYETPIREKLKNAVTFKDPHTHEETKLRSSFDSLNTTNTRKSKNGEPTNYGDDHSILVLVYFIALKELKYHGEGAEPIQSGHSSFEGSYDRDYKDAYNLFISYLMGEKAYKTQRDELQGRSKGTVLKSIADNLTQAEPEEGLSSYTTHQIMTIFAHLKSSADLVILEQSAQDKANVQIDERERAIQNLNESITQLHQMFVDLAGIVQDMNHVVVSIAEKVDSAHLDAAQGTLDVMKADREQAKSMPFAAWFFPATTKATIKEMENTVASISRSSVVPSYYDAVPKNDLGRAYHQIWSNDTAKPLSERIVALMDNYCRPGGFLSCPWRTHRSRALKIKEKITSLSNEDKKDPIKLGEIIQAALNDLDNNQNSYSAFRARCHFILNKLDDMVVKLRPVPITQEEKSEHRLQH